QKTPTEQDVLTVPEVFDSMESAIFGGLKEAAGRKSSNKNPAIPDMQRNLQREYVGHLIFLLLEGEGWYPAQIQTLARHYVQRLGGIVKDTLAAGGGLDTYTRAHLEECQNRLDRALEASYTINR
ncbi:MAG: hypothetical protein ACREID_08625, partial [Planctomycetota bacterium]